MVLPRASAQGTAHNEKTAKIAEGTIPKDNATQSSPRCAMQEETTLMKENFELPESFQGKYEEEREKSGEREGGRPAIYPAGWLGVIVVPQHFAATETR